MVDTESEVKQAHLEKVLEELSAAKAGRRAAEAAARQAEAAETAAQETAAADKRVKNAKDLQAIAEAEQKTAEAQQKQWSALIPDLSKVTGGGLEIKDGPAIAQHSLTFGALTRAAETIANRIKLQAQWRVLVTSDSDLASVDFQFNEVWEGMTQLVLAVDTLLPETRVEGIDEVSSVFEEFPPDAVETKGIDEQAPDDTGAVSDQANSLGAMGLGGVVAAAGGLAGVGAAVGGGPLGLTVGALGAIASAIPQILSYFSVNRTVTTAEVTVTDLAAAAAVAGTMEKRTPSIEVVKDDFRLVVPGRLQRKRQVLATKRLELLARKIALTDRKSAVDAALAIAISEQKDAEKAITDAKSQTDPLKERLRNARANVAHITQKSARATVRLSLVEALLNTVDAFTTAILSTPEGGARSPLAAASLADQLHVGAPEKDSLLENAPPNQELFDGKPNPPSESRPYFTHVMLVKAEKGQATLVSEDRQGPRTDEFSAIVEANVTYMLVATSNSSVVSSGTVSATQAVHGEFGKDIVIRPIDIS